MRTRQTWTITAASLLAGLFLSACGGTAAGEGQPTPPTDATPASASTTTKSGQEYKVEHRCTDTGAGIACKASDAGDCPSALAARNVIRRQLDSAGRATTGWEKIATVCNADEARQIIDQD